MKNIKFLSVLLLMVTAFSFTSCDNEPIDSAIIIDDTNNEPVVFKADFSGQTWNAQTAIANIVGNNISIEGFKSNGEGFGFSLSAVSLGTFPANDNIVAFIPSGSEYGYWGINPENATEETGSVIVTEIDTVNKTISGTFSFKGYWSDTTVTNILPIVFTNGVFQNIPYTSQNIPSTDSFSASFDGTNFVESQIDVVQILNDTNQPVAISIVGSNNNDENVGLRIPYGITVGTHPFTADTPNFGGTSVMNNLLFVANSGTVTITSKTATRIQGTFSYSAFNFTQNLTKEVTQGTFDVEY